MAEIKIEEFPFVKELKAKEITKLRKFMNTWEDFKEVTAKHGPLMPREFCAQLGNVTKQRVAQLIEEGKLEAVIVVKQVMVTEDSFERWMKSDRSRGRKTKTSGLSKVKLAVKMFGAAAKDLEGTAVHLSTLGRRRPARQPVTTGHK